KTASTSWGTGGAASIMVIEGDGGISFSTNETNTFKICGLSSVNSDANYDTIDFGILLWNNGSVSVFEGGVDIGILASYSTSDSFTIERIGASILYKKNDTLFYTSALSSSGNLLADCAIYNHNGSISDALIFGSSPMSNTLPVALDQSISTNLNTPVAVTLEATDADSDPLTFTVMDPPAHGTLTGSAPDLTYTPDTEFNGVDSFTFVANDAEGPSNTATVSIAVISPIVWTDLVGVSASSNTVTKTASTSWGTGGAASIMVIEGDGGISFSTNETNTFKICGLS
ncbi:MAG: hypothetical protein GY861_03585, partial [bacterium]|nr:hypothetical protein [bacterium]